MIVEAVGPRFVGPTVHLGTFCEGCEYTRLVGLAIYHNFCGIEDRSGQHSETRRAGLVNLCAPLGTI